jgi:hypothetical protein
MYSIGTPLSEGGGNCLGSKEGMRGGSEKRKKRLAVLSWSQYLNGRDQRLARPAAGVEGQKGNGMKGYLTFGSNYCLFLSIGMSDPAQWCPSPLLFSPCYFWTQLLSLPKDPINQISVAIVYPCLVLYHAPVVPLGLAPRLQPRHVLEHIFIFIEARTYRSISSKGNYQM